MAGDDSASGFLSGDRDLSIAVAGGVVIFILLLAVLGGGGAVGLLGVVVYTLVWLAVVLFVLWLFYRLVVAVERIAHAQQRIAAAENPPSGARATTNDGTSGAGGDGTSGAEAGEEADGSDGETDDA